MYCKEVSKVVRIRDCNVGLRNVRHFGELNACRSSNYASAASVLEILRCESEKSRACKISKRTVRVWEVM